jgi:pyridoxine 5-phosphate synthase
MTRLSVNIDHVATLRQARGTLYPSPLEAAAIAEAAGAHGITVHLRCDRRHIQDADVTALRGSVQGKLNLEMSVEPEMKAIAIESRPDQVTLVPERPEEITTEGGLDLVHRTAEVERTARDLTGAGVSVSLFLDPDPEQVRAATNLFDVVDGFEINTDSYSKCKPTETAADLARIAECSRLGALAGLAVYAGHGLTAENVGPIAGIPEIEELNIGHALISRAVLIGLEEAVREMLAAMAAGG